MSINAGSFRKLLLAWYQNSRRDLPWRRTSDPYRIWLSEIMLQQTRVSAVIPYYHAFLERFPTVEALARAREEDVLTQWAGLGYYSRARNLQKAARLIMGRGGFPETYEEILALPGIGSYTAAAIASIAFHKPFAVLDGNVMRVLSRLENDSSDIGSPRSRQRLQSRAQQLLDVSDPGTSNQAIMELGATVCLPRSPECASCPVVSLCTAHRHGTQRELPVKGGKPDTVQVEKTLLLIAKRSAILMWFRPAGSQRLQGFWELPESTQLPGAVLGRSLGEFRHSITHHRFRVTVVEARIRNIPKGFCFIDHERIAKIPVTTATKKALACSTP